MPKTCKEEEKNKKTKKVPNTVGQKNVAKQHSTRSASSGTGNLVRKMLDRGAAGTYYTDKRSNKKSSKVSKDEVEKKVEIPPEDDLKKKIEILQAENEASLKEIQSLKNKNENLSALISSEAENSTQDDFVSEKTLDEISNDSPKGKEETRFQILLDLKKKYKKLKEEEEVFNIKLQQIKLEKRSIGLQIQQEESVAKSNQKDTNSTCISSHQKVYQRQEYYNSPFPIPRPLNSMGYCPPYLQQGIAPMFPRIMPAQNFTNQYQQDVSYYYSHLQPRIPFFY